MKATIDWTLFLETTKLPKGEKIVRTFAQAIEIPVEETHFEPYWKEKRLLRVTARSELRTDSVRDALFEVMSACSGAAGAWLIAVPHHPDKIWEFGGTSNAGAMKIPGIDSVSFTARVEPASVEAFPSDRQSPVCVAEEDHSGIDDQRYTVSAGAGIPIPADRP